MWETVLYFPSPLKRIPGTSFQRDRRRQTLPPGLSTPLRRRPFPEPVGGVRDYKGTTSWWRPQSRNPGNRYFVTFVLWNGNESEKNVVDSIRVAHMKRRQQLYVNKF